MLAYRAFHRCFTVGGRTWFGRRKEDPVIKPNTETVSEQLRARVAELERRLGELGEHIKKLTHHTAELERLKDEVAALKYEVEDLREE